MSKITLTNLANLQNENTAVNAFNTNNAVIIAAMDNTLSRDGTQPNTMLSDLDMNSHQIFNLPAPSTINSPARLIDVVSNPNIVIPGTGTSGHLVPYLDGNNTWSGTNNFTQPVSIPYVPTGAGATNRTIDAKLKDSYLSVKDFGATGNGSTDDTNAIRAADAVALSQNKGVWFPTGNYKVSSTLVPSSGAHWIGENYQNTVLMTNQATGDVVAISNGFVTIENMTWNSSVPRTAGHYVTISSVVARLRDFRMDNSFEGIYLSSSAVADVLIENGTIISVNNSSIGMRLSGGLAVEIQNIVLSYDGVHHPFAQIYIDNGGDYNITNVQCLAGQTGMQIAPASGQSVAYVRCTHCYFDTSVNNGLIITQSGTGTVVGCDFVQCWASSSTAGNGVLIQSNGSGTIANVNFSEGYFLANFNSGFFISGSTVTGVGIVNSVFTNNVVAIAMGGSCANVRVIGNQINNCTNGITFDGSTLTGILVLGNSFYANGAAIPSTLISTTSRIESNLGYNPVGISNLTPGVSPWTYTAGSIPETILFAASTSVASATISGISAIPAGTGANINSTVPLGPNQSIIITYAGTLTARSLKQ